jgi:Putative zinc-finger
MTLLTCAAVRRRLAAFHDRELPVGELIAIETHIKECPPCARELRDLQRVGEALRLAAAPAPADDWTGLQSGVISRMRAEANESWTARGGRLFEDLHLVWIGLASTAATFLCGAVVLSMLHFASPERNDSLASVISLVTGATGSDVNPALLDAHIRVPSVPQDGPVGVTLARVLTQDELVLPLSVTVTREGRVSGVSPLTDDHSGHDIRDILDAVSRARLEPAQFGGSPVAVSLVWLLAHTTVKGTPVVKGKIS